MENELKQQKVHLSNTVNIPQKLPLLQLEKYSKLKTVFRITAWIKQFVHNIRFYSKTQGELNVEEIEEAERYWASTVKDEHYHKEILAIRAGKEIHKKSKIKGLKPFLDKSGLICVGGRLESSNTV